MTFRVNSALVENDELKASTETNDFVLEHKPSGAQFKYNNSAGAWEPIEGITTPDISNTDYNETVNSLGSVTGATDIDLTSGNTVEATLTGDTTFSFSGASSSPSGNSFTLVVQQDGTGGHAITWPGSVEWDSGASPSLSTNANDKHMLSFVSLDGGTTWIGIEGPQQIA